MTRSFYNAVSTTLSSSMTSTQTTMTLPATLDTLAGVTVTFPIDVHIEAETTNTDEIVQVTSLSSGTTYNITRASEAYGGVQSASAHSSGANVRVAVVTAGALAALAAGGGTPAENAAALVTAYNLFR